MLPVVLCCLWYLLEIRVEHNPGFGLPSVAILPQFAESDIKQFSLLHYKSRLATATPGL